MIYWAENDLTVFAVLAELNVIELVLVRVRVISIKASPCTDMPFNPTAVTVV